MGSYSESKYSELNKMTEPKFLRTAGWNILVLLGSSMGITVICLLLGLGMMDIVLFYNYFQHPLLFLLNWVPVFLFQLLLYALFNRQWLSFLITSLVFILASIGDFYKLKFRSEPFLFSDISSVNAALSVAGNYDLKPNTRVVLGVACILLGTAIIFILARRKMNRKSRIAATAAVLLLIYPLWKGVYSNEEIYNSKATSSTSTIFGWTQRVQVAKGFIYQFIYSINENVVHMPTGYDEKEFAELFDSGKDTSIPEEKKVNILAFQLEAYSDLNTLGIEGIADDVYSGLYKLQKEGISGKLIANVFAGGTINTERCFLSGSYRMPEYRKNMETYVWYLRNHGYTTTGSHPHHEIIYNRVNITRYMGFMNYWFLENKYQEMVDDLPNQWLSDHILFPEATDELLTLAKNGPVFSFNVTMQGHSPYPTDTYVYKETFWEGDEYSEETRIIMNNYLGSVKDTSDLLWETAERIRNEDTPIVMVFYGDHKPWLGDGNSAYNELGISFTINDKKSLEDRFATPYVIWANNAAKDLLGNDFSGSGPDISPCFLMNVLFHSIGWEENTVMKFTDSVMDRIPIINTAGYYVEDGQFTTKLDETGKRLLQKYDGLQYYLFKHPELAIE